MLFLSPQLSKERTMKSHLKLLMYRSLCVRPGDTCWEMVLDRKTQSWADPGHSASTLLMQSPHRSPETMRRCLFSAHLMHRIHFGRLTVTKLFLPEHWCCIRIFCCHNHPEGRLMRMCVQFRAPMTLGKPVTQNSIWWRFVLICNSCHLQPCGNPLWCNIRLWPEKVTKDFSAEPSFPSIHH